jgi:hypothetical protein
MAPGSLRLAPSADAASSTGGTAGVSSGSESTQHLPPQKRPQTASWVFLALVAVVLVVLLGVFLFVFVLPAHHGGNPTPSGTVLAPAGQDYDVFVSQSSVISFTLNATTILSGSFTTTYGITAFVLTNQAYANYSHYGSVSSYEWSSGQVSSGTISESLPAGSWNLAFIDVTAQATSVLITSPITLTPA